REQWAAWRAALASARLAWRQVVVEVTGKLELAPVLACCPAVEVLRVLFVGDPAGPGDLDWDGVRAEQLRLLWLANCGDVGSLDRAELPRLEELRLLGGSTASEELRTSLRWQRMKRVILGVVGANTNEGDGDDTERPGTDEQAQEPPVCTCT